MAERDPVTGRFPKRDAPARGAGHGGPATGASAAPRFAADNQPPGAAKSAGKEVAAEIRAKIAARKDDILEAQLARATDAANPSGHAAAVDLLNRIMPPVSKIELSEATPDQMTDEELAAIASRGRATAIGKAED